MDKLTPREREVAIELHKGGKGKEVAHRLGITYGTYQGHLHSIYKKLGIGGAKELALFVERAKSADAAK